ncbi:phosphate import ATP-binding protein PstB [Iodidimonas gelatinilytica]|uniref:Phosphate import ATP-binding protein PstB n=1 Tax=Iodidimonas gelatinilytica TaxID=1236966 RepID=A0A5A7MNW4_9PROT|nr:phosphate ABC transporter ATP-binding protein [Iodidimonas gelatinilytica]GEQ96589.1 phosphate import ATP-binding protein PstB [Iodidimonas gelatinilytica]
MVADAPAGPYALETSALNVAYHGKRALCDVSLKVRPNSITAIVGPSGCGKSSFLTALNRLDETVPGCTVSGDVRLFGTSLHDHPMPLEDLRRRVAMIFQRPTPFPLSIRRNMEIPIFEHFGPNRAHCAQRMESALEAVGLLDEVKDRLDCNATLLSGGQQQRLCLARALALEPHILLLDEPCSALDPLATEKVETLLKSLKQRLSLVLVTHNMAQAQRLADDMALFWVKNGCGYVAEAGPATALLHTPQSAEGRDYFSGRLG